LVAGNWKMNMTIAEAVGVVRALRDPLGGIGGITRVVCPPFVALSAVAGELAGTEIHVGAQNMHSEPRGAFTGEVSGSMLDGLCQYVIVGHSERRHIFGETNEFINRKVRAALDIGLTPIFCLGETLVDREAGRAPDVCHDQLIEGLADVAPDDFARVVVAYEPVWAIGTGRAATPELAQEIMGALRYELACLSHVDVAARVPLLYGGSVTGDNVASFAEQRDIDGALVGGASLSPEQFVAIASTIADARASSL